MTKADLENTFKGAVDELKTRTAPAAKVFKAQVAKARKQLEKRGGGFAKELERGRKELARGAEAARAGLFGALGVASKDEVSRLSKKVAELAKKLPAA